MFWFFSRAYGRDWLRKLKKNKRIKKGNLGIFPLNDLRPWLFPQVWGQGSEKREARGPSHSSYDCSWHWGPPSPGSTDVP